MRDLTAMNQLLNLFIISIMLGVGRIPLIVYFLSSSLTENDLRFYNGSDRKI